MENSVTPDPRQPAAALSFTPGPGSWLSLERGRFHAQRCVSGRSRQCRAASGGKAKGRGQRRTWGSFLESPWKAKKAVGAAHGVGGGDGRFGAPGPGRGSVPDVL